MYTEIKMYIVEQFYGNKTTTNEPIHLIYKCFVCTYTELNGCVLESNLKQGWGIS